MAITDGAWVWSNMKGHEPRLGWQCRVVWSVSQISGDIARVTGSLYIHRYPTDSNYPYVIFEKGVSWNVGGAYSGKTTANSSQIGPNGSFRLKSDFTIDYPCYYSGYSNSPVTCGIWLSESDFYGTRNGSVVFYPTIPAKTSYTVSYDANGGSGAPGAQTKWYNETLTLSTAQPTRTGYIFDGWYTSPSGGSKYGATYTGNYSAILYAHWIERTYSVNYNYGNYVNTCSNLPATQTKYYTRNLTITSQKPTQFGYDFINWNTKADGSGTGYNSGATYSNNSSTTLYAQWAKTVFTIEYKGNKPSGAESSPTNIPPNGSKTYAENTNIDSMEPQLLHYTFLGWSKTSNGEVIYMPGDVYTEEANITLYAIWKPDEYTVRYDGQEANSNVPSSQVKLHGIDLKLSTLVPLKNYYTFNNWCDAQAPSSSSTSYNPGDDYIKNENVQLYAQYDPNEIDVFYKRNESDPTPGSQIITYDNDVRFTNPSEYGMTKLGYHYNIGEEWNTLFSGNGTTYSTQIDYEWETFGSPINTITNITLYPKWVPNNYIIVFDKNAQYATGNMDSLSMTYDQGKNLTPNAFARTGYTFVEWNTARNGSGISYTNEAFVNNLVSTHNGSITLYAQWRLNVTPPNLSKILSQRCTTQHELLEDGETVKIQLTEIILGEYYDESNAQTAYFSPTQWAGDIRDAETNNIIFSWSKQNITYEDTKPTIYTSDSIIIDKDREYNITVTTYSYTDNREFIDDISDFVSKAFFIIDISANGRSIAFGRSAPDESDTYYFGEAVEILSDGNIKMQLDEEAASGTLDYQLKAAFDALGWQDIYS